MKEQVGAEAYEYLHGPGIDEPAIQLCLGSNCAVASSYYYADGLGSIHQPADSSGNILNQYRYGSWGELDQAFIKQENIKNNYTYTSRELFESYNYYYRSRIYNAKIKYFISKDKLIFGNIYNIYSLDNFYLSIKLHSIFALKKILQNYLILYKYAKNNPINYKDPFGLEACDEKARRLGWTQNQCEDCCDKVARDDSTMCSTAGIVLGVALAAASSEIGGAAGAAGICFAFACRYFINKVEDYCKDRCRKYVNP